MDRSPRGETLRAIALAQSSDFEYDSSPRKKERRYYMGSHKKHERKKELRRKWKRQEKRKKLSAKGLNPDESNKIKKMA
jgi:hypothetical protein